MTATPPKHRRKKLLKIFLFLGVAGAIGAITAPIVAGQAADRHFRTEWYMAFLLAASGLLKWYASHQTSYVEWLCLSVAFSILYIPTLSLAPRARMRSAKNTNCRCCGEGCGFAKANTLLKTGSSPAIPRTLVG